METRQACFLTRHAIGFRDLGTAAREQIRIVQTTFQVVSRVTKPQGKASS